MSTTEAVSTSDSAESGKILEATTTETTDLKRLVRAVEHTISEAPVRFNEEGIKLEAADAAMVAKTDLHLRPEFFDYFQFNDDGDLLIGISIEELKDKVTEARKGEELTFYVEEKLVDGDRKPYLHVQVDSDGIVSTSELKRLNLSEEDIPDTEDLEFQGSVTVSVEKLKDAFDRIDSHVRFKTGESSLKLKAYSGDVQVEFPESSNHVTDIQMDDGEVESLHSMDYLEAVSKLKHTVEELRIDMGTDFPILFTAVETLSFDFSYLIAPRIEEA